MMRGFRVALAAALLIGGSAVWAQEQGGSPPFPGDGPGGPPPGFGGGPPMGGRGGRMRQITAATIPADALSRYLKLSTDQEKKIRAVEEKLRAERPRPPAPPQGGGFENGGQPQRPSREEMEARFKKIQAAEAKANKSILEALTAEQKAKLPQLIKALSALRADRISLSAAGKLNLSQAQIKRLAKAGANATHEIVVSDFTATQNEIADSSRMEPRGRGGFPGGGPPDGGFPGPPPEGGPGGPGGFGGPGSPDGER